MKKISYYLSLVAGILVVIFALCFGIRNRLEVTQQRSHDGYSKIENYECREIRDNNAPAGVKKEYTFILEELLKQDDTLAFYTVHQYVSVWMEGEKIYELKPSKDASFCKTVGSNWSLIPLYREDVGKEIKVEITPVYESFINREVDYLVGSELAIYRDRLSKDVPQLILSLMAIIVGLIILCVTGYSFLWERKESNMGALGLFSVMMGIWRLTDTRFTPFIFPEQPVLLFNLSVMMLMIGMLPLIVWLKKSFTEKSAKIMDIYCIVCALNCFVQLFCQITGIADLRENLIITHVIIGVGVVLAVIIAIYEKIKYPDKNSSKKGDKLPYICVAGVVGDVIAFYLKGNSSGLLFSLLGFVLYILLVGIRTLLNYSKQELQLAEQEHQLAEQEHQLAEKDRKLTERRIASMMSQIRSHFIFNVLTTISGYCKIDPQKADEALIRFSRYLRKNINIIEEEGLINFDQELEQVEDYVALEQMRFEGMIGFEKEINTSSFKIPPLTIQPIVENSIKHGLVQLGKSGTIKVKTERFPEYIEITVCDDGVGFAPQEDKNKDSVGIRNVRYRLEKMVGGKLSIDSSLGKGTKVTIQIPNGEIKNESNLR